VSVPIVVVVTVGIASTLVLAGLVGATIKQMKVLSRSMRGFGDAVAGPLGEIRRRSDEARRRVEALAERQAALSEHRAVRR